MKRRRAGEPATSRPAKREGDVVVAVVEGDPALAPLEPLDALLELRAITAEGVIIQDAAEELLAAIRRRDPLAELAPRGGRLTSRFVALREALPDCTDVEVRRLVRVLRAVFDHHALMVESSLEMLAFDWRSGAIVEQLEKIDGLGPPAQWLEEVRREVVRRTDAAVLA